MKCRHLSMTHVGPPGVVAFRCNWCGDYVPLGKARDDDPRVAVEIRAAELAHNEIHMMRLISTGIPGQDDEVDGYIMAIGDRHEPWNSAQLAGYLAHAITKHEAP